MDVQKSTDGINISDDMVKDGLIIEYDSVKNNKENIKLAKKVLNTGQPVVFVSDNISKEDICNLLDIKIGSRFKQTGDSILKGIKVEKYDDSYLFNFIFCDNKENNNKYMRDLSLYRGYQSTKLKDSVPKIKKITEIGDNSLSLSNQVTTGASVSAEVSKGSLLGVSTPVTTGDYKIEGGDGATYTYTDATVEVSAKTYYYKPDRTWGLNYGDFTCNCNFSQVYSMYTYVGVPDDAKVNDYAPRDGKKVSSGSTNVSIAIGAFTVNLSPDVSTKYKLDSGGIGSGHVQLIAKQQAFGGDYYSGSGDVLETPQLVEYKSPSQSQNGAFTFSTFGLSYNHNDGFNVY